MMSPKTNCKGARNPCREMTHENSGKTGHSATADTDEESDVAGYSTSAFVDERRVASSIIELSSCEAVESHTSAQVPFVPLCRACIVGKGQSSSTTFSPWWCSVDLCNNVDRVAGKFVIPFERQHAQNCSE